MRLVSQRSFRLLIATACTAAAAVMLVPPQAAVQAQEPPCAGTLLKLSVMDKGQTTIERFRFRLALSGEGSSERAALNQLNQRVRSLRQQLKPLIQGRLVVPSPSTHRRGGSATRPQVFVANARISGEVSRRDYNALIQAAGGQPGVRLQGMESIANEQDEQALQKRLMASALQRGKAEADGTAAAIGATRVRLVAIHRSDAIRGPRSVKFSADARSAFDPDEAPEPTASVRMDLQYCLT